MTWAARTTSTATLRVLRSTGPRSDPTVQSSLLDWGFSGSDVWVPTSRGADYCRDVGGTNNVDSYIACTPFDGTSFGSTVQSSLLDWGFSGSDVWVPTSSGADYCRDVGGTNNVDSYIACTPFDGTSFGSTVQSSLLDWGFDGTSVWVPTSSGADYCRDVGGTNNVDSYIACTPFDGTSFGSTVQSSLLDWGFDGTSVWVPTSSGADYCRDVGGTNNVNSYIACTPFDGTSFGSTVQSSLLDWGFDGTSVSVPTSHSADYCRDVGGTNNVDSYIACTPFDGTSFGSHRPVVIAGLGVRRHERVGPDL